MELSTDYPVVVISCSVFKDLLEKHLPNGKIKNLIYLDYGLHRIPKNLRRTLQDEIDHIEQPSLIVLGYGLCGNSLHQIDSGIHTLLIPRTDDCIAILLGSRQAYQKEFFSNPGTYYLSKGWLESGSNPLQEYDEYTEKYGETQSEWLLDQQYKNYKRLAMVAHNQNDMEHYRAQAIEVAHFCERWGMRYEEIMGSEDYIKKLVEIALDLKHESDDFVIIPPGNQLTQGDFLH